MADDLTQRINNLIANRKLPKSTQKHHPDSHELNDWAIYGPKDETIANLVWSLAYKHDLRLSEIEGLIEKALRDKFASLDSHLNPDK